MQQQHAWRWEGRGAGWKSAEGDEEGSEARSRMRERGREELTRECLNREGYRGRFYPIGKRRGGSKPKCIDWGPLGWGSV